MLLGSKYSSSDRKMAWTVTSLTPPEVSPNTISHIIRVKPTPYADVSVKPLLFMASLKFGDFQEARIKS